MTSFLVECKQCKVSIGKGSPCPDCGWSETEIVPEDAERTLNAFADRQRLHTRNATLNMGLMLVTGALSLATAGMWFWVIYFGSVSAFIWVGILTVLSAALGFLLAFATRVWPIELNCPSCDIRLDELGSFGPRCPSCSIQLR